MPQVTGNGAKEPVDIALPFTVGMWEKTEPVGRERNALLDARKHVLVHRPAHPDDIAAEIRSISQSTYHRDCCSSLSNAFGPRTG